MIKWIRNAQMSRTRNTNVAQHIIVIVVTIMVIIDFVVIVTIIAICVPEAPLKLEKISLSAHNISV